VRRRLTFSAIFLLFGNLKLKLPLPLPLR
jgi:hypothetical protein